MWWLILGFLMVVGGLFILSISIDENLSCEKNFWSGTGFMFLIFLGMELIIAGICSEYPYPQAIDVYRGNTTLEITYRDSVPVDTTVVWKENK